ncbi:zinc finger protein 420-like isoform X1 [Coregonus clupeaformis]|uniref:zinc finger protein 420-like isoform X1 n=2 Tax=Coregonus clupeaformis TaxID=59861 RepID=UPI001BDFCD8C|nr:zinc finger protein 420-like isoform X1 [Coregonus clupeaformis]XP_045069828.1 zinc finger protein 420-like isoform X1 [Coregonus clupeaformis]
MTLGLVVEERDPFWLISTPRGNTSVCLTEYSLLKEKRKDPVLSLSSLHLLVPPLRLLSAAMWQVAQQRDVRHYEKLEEFVTLVTEAIPELLSHRHRAQLILGLRARLVLELCRGPADPQTIQPYLDRMPTVTPGCTGYRDAEVEASESNFVMLVQSLLKDPVERECFFQEVFPEQYGQHYDTAVQTLTWEFLSRLEQLFPVPDLKQTATWLSSAPSVLEECVQSTPENLNLILQHHKSFGHLKVSSALSSMGDSILSSLSTPKMVVITEPTTFVIRSESSHNSADVLGPMSLEDTDAVVVTVYTEVEVGTEVEEEIVETMNEEYVPSNTSPLREEVVELKAEDMNLEMTVVEQFDYVGEEMSAAEEEMDTASVPVEQADEAVNISEDIRTATETVAVKKDVQDDQDGQSETVNVCVNQEGKDTSHGVTFQTQQPASSNVRRSTRLQSKTPRNWRRKGNTENKNNGEASSVDYVILPKGREAGESDKVTLFTCPKCAYHSLEETSLHLHMQSIHTEEYNKFNASGKNRAEVSPCPDNTDQIFTSIKPLLSSNPLITENSENQTDNAGTRTKAKGYHKSHTCATCGRIFTRSSDVRRHQLTHTGERPFHCSQCDRTFQHSWDLTKHEKKHGGTSISFPCQQCGSSFANLRSLTAHHRSSHLGESDLPHLCSICGKSFPSSSELLEHRKSHGTSLQYICQPCGESFHSLLARSQHRQTHLVKRQFKCPHCDKSYTRKADVKRHMFTHSGERPHQCNQCGRCFSFLFLLKKHQIVHTGERPFQCSHCPKRFTLISILSRHERMHTGERPFLCSVCGKSFLSQGELSKHHRSHTDERPYACNQCDKRFKSKKSQQEHIISHTGVRPYPCSYCGKGFTKPYALTRHHLIHTGERPFSCTHCGKTFLTPAEVQLHMRIHTGERPYPCPDCQLKFRSSSDLARHKRFHTGVQTFVCNQCMKNFPTSSKLKKHMENHSGTEAVQRSDFGENSNQA